MLVVAVGHVSIGRRVLRVFLHVMRCVVLYNAGHGDCVADMVRERDLAASYLPCTAVLTRQKKFFGIVSLAQTSGNVSDVGFFFCVRILGAAPGDADNSQNQSQDQTADRVDIHEVPSWKRILPA